MFNPRARVGATSADPGQRFDIIFNPLAPWGATSPQGVLRLASGIFNHAPAWGATGRTESAYLNLVFLSTRPRGARLNVMQPFLVDESFNPRARVGRDAYPPGPCGPQLCFNPRARVGRDQIPSRVHYLFRCFNPRARVGRDDCLFFTWARSARFNPRARVGRDARSARKDALCAGFNPRARVGRDRALGYWPKPRWCFNPRARVGRDASITGLLQCPFQSIARVGASSLNKL